MDTGKTIGHYRIIRQLGKGGMGEVYLAEDTRLQRQVALKFLPESVRNDPDRLARFRREALAAASLKHPNSATIYAFEEAVPGDDSTGTDKRHDAGAALRGRPTQDANAIPFITMEYVDGMPLSAYIPAHGMALVSAGRSPDTGRSSHTVGAITQDRPYRMGCAGACS